MWKNEKFSLTLFWQKFRESKVFTKEVTKKLISRNIFRWMEFLVFYVYTVCPCPFHETYQFFTWNRFFLDLSSCLLLKIHVTFYFGSSSKLWNLFCEIPHEPRLLKNVTFLRFSHFFSSDHQLSTISSFIWPKNFVCFCFDLKRFQENGSKSKTISWLI